jgi:hypothetical protein
MRVYLPAIHTDHRQWLVVPENSGLRSTVMDSATMRPVSLTRHVSHGTNPIIVSTNCPMQFISVTTCTRGGGISAPFGLFCGQLPSRTVSLAVKPNLNRRSSCCSFNVLGLGGTVEVVGGFCLSATLDLPGPPVVIRPPILNLSCSPFFSSSGSFLMTTSPSSLSLSVRSIIGFNVEFHVK